MGYNSFEELDVWKRACLLAVGIYESLRNCRDYGLKDQMTRSAVSIASNIAEGAERNSRAEYIRFLHIGQGISRRIAHASLHCPTNRHLPKHPSHRTCYRTERNIIHASGPNQIP